MAGDICIKLQIELRRKNEGRQMKNTTQKCPCKKALRHIGVKSMS